MRIYPKFTDTPITVEQLEDLRSLTPQDEWPSLYYLTRSEAGGKIRRLGVEKLVRGFKAEEAEEAERKRIEQERLAGERRLEWEQAVRARKRAEETAAQVGVKAGPTGIAVPQAPPAGSKSARGVAGRPYKSHWDGPATEKQEWFLREQRFWRAGMTKWEAWTLIREIKGTGA